MERALRLGASIGEVAVASGGIDPWFLDQIAALVELRAEIVAAPVLDVDLLRRAKRAGLSDGQLAALRPELAAEDGVRTLRHRLGIRPVYKTVDTCAAEFEAVTPYHYSSYDAETEVVGSDRPKVLILGSGPNRIGQGIEFDYSCVHAVQALRGAYETVMVNCNPETVSTDYDTADRLYFEPLTFEDVMEVWHAEDSSGRAAGGPGVIGVIVQLGGQTPLGLAQRLKDAGVPVVGTSPESIHLAEERGAFGSLLARAGLRAPAHGTATSYEEAKEIADEIGYPVLVRPSYVLGGRGMEIVYDDVTLRDYIGRATDISPNHPVLVDRFLDDAIEIDVDALCDADGEVYLGGIMEHIEEAGIHSGDSSCALPPITLASSHVAQVRRYTEAIARGIGVRGLLNVQYALKDDVLYVLEANPRASRTVPFVSKATAVPLAKAAARIALGATIAELRDEGLLPASGDGGTLPPDAPIAVKEAVLPFKRFRTPAGKGVDSLARPGDEVDRRGDGHRHRLRARLRQVAGGGVRFAADLGPDLRLGGQPRQARHDLPDQAPGRPGLRDRRDQRHRRGAAPPRHRLRAGLQALRVRCRRRRGVADPLRPDRPGDQHSAGFRCQRPLRRLRDPQRRGDGGHPLHHHRPRRRRRGDGHRGSHPRRHAGPPPPDAPRRPPSPSPPALIMRLAAAKEIDIAVNLMINADQGGKEGGRSAGGGV